jgi:protein-tyrosine phosphatase
VWTDLHNHVIPGVDDGAQTVEESIVAIQALAAEGVRRVVATPHFQGSLTVDHRALAKRLKQLDAGWSRLRQGFDEGAGPRLARGAEVQLDIPHVDLSDPRIRLAGGEAVLVEFPYFMVPPRSGLVLGSIREAGYIPLLAHPERYQGVEPTLTVVRSWLDAGAFLQINAGSLFGRYGSQARDNARALLERGWAHCLASDFHGRGWPNLWDAHEFIRTEAEEGSDESGDHVRLLLDVNPSRLVEGKLPVPVRPLPPRSTTLQRLVRRFTPGRTARTG